jgi:hypothetical protein
MFRRSFFAAILASSALVACSTITDSGVANAATDAALIADGLAAVDVQLGNLGVIDPKTMTVIGSALGSVQSVATALAKVTDKAAAQPLVTKLETYVNAFVSAAAGIPLLPPSIQLALQAASILLPVIEVAVGLVLPSAPKASAATMTPAQARLVLKGTAMAPASVPTSVRK